MYVFNKCFLSYMFPPELSSEGNHGHNVYYLLGIYFNTILLFKTFLVQKNSMPILTGWIKIHLSSSYFVIFRAWAQCYQDHDVHAQLCALTSWFVANFVRLDVMIFGYFWLFWAYMPRAGTNFFSHWNTCLSNYLCV